MGLFPVRQQELFGWLLLTSENNPSELPAQTVTRNNPPYLPSPIREEASNQHRKPGQSFSAEAMSTISMSPSLMRRAAERAMASSGSP